MNRRRLLINRLLTPAALAILILLSACANRAQPTATTLAKSTEALVTASGESTPTLQSPDLGGSLNPEEMATRDAALENSGKSGPTLPPGDLQPQPELPETKATPTSSGVQAGVGSVATPNQAQPGETQATLSPDQIATRDAALENSGKSGSTPLSEATPSATNCLGGAALILVPLAVLTILRRKR